MANFLNKILLWKEATVDTIPASPACYAFKAESFGITASQASESINELGNGRGASSKAFGTLSISGDLGMIWNEDNAPILFSHGIGAATVTAAATTDVWVTATVYAKGDIINHTDGIHSLVAYVGGTSGATIPNLTAYTTANAGRGVKVVDGTVTWIIMPKLFEQSGERGDCLPSFGVEVKDDDTCGVSSPAYTRYTGLHIGSLPMTISGSMMSLKSSVSTMGMTEEDSIIVTANGGTYEAMSAKVGFTEKELLSNYYFLEDCSFYLDGSLASVKTVDFSATINNNVTMEDALNNKKINNLGIVSIDGTMQMLMDSALFASAAGHVIKNAKFTFSKPNGCLMEIEFPQIKLEKTNKVYATDKTTMINISFSGLDTSTVKSIKWRTISPTSY